MNPRHRRLLIPGLLVALVIVVVIASLTQKADAADDGSVVVSIIDDARITEASGLAVSRSHDDLVYVINDSGNVPAVYAVRLTTGDIVGTTTVQGVRWRDTEAMTLGPDDTLWIADTGDNLRRRDDVALYAFAEPGPGDHVVSARRYPVSLPDGPDDIEAMMIDPRDGRVFLAGKGLLAGTLYRFGSDLSQETVNTPEALADRVPGLVTDGAFTGDGERMLLRTYVAVHEYWTGDRSRHRSIAVPQQKQGESLAVERGDESFLIGTEGRPSPIVRVPIPPEETSAPTPSPTPTSDVPRATDDESSHAAWWIGGGAAIGAVAALLLLRRR